MLVIHRMVWVSTVLCVAACGERTKAVDEPIVPPPPPPAAYMGFIGASGGVDTIEAVLTQPLTVQVSRGSTLVRGARVVFTTRTPPRFGSPVVIAPKSASTFAMTAEDTTAADGTAGVRVQLGTMVGPSYVIASVPALGLIDSALFTVRTGRAVASKFSVQPTDTAVMMGSTLKLRIFAPDRAGNATTDYVYQPSFGLTAIGGDSGVRAGTEFVRASVAVSPSAGSPTTVVRVSVVPRDSMAIERYTNFGGRFEISYHTMRLDGSGDRTLALSPWQFTGPRWHPDGRLVFWDTVGIRAFLPTGTQTPVFTTGRWSTAPYYPRITQAGDWIYFIMFVNGQRTFGRSRADGSGVEAVSGPVDHGDFDVLPDGSALIAIRNNTTVVQRFDLQTRTFGATYGFGAALLRVSPQGNQFAFITPAHDALKVASVVPGGAPREILRTPLTDAQINWTRDGQYLLVAQQDGRSGEFIIGSYSLVRVSDGVRLPIPFLVNDPVTGYGEAAIRP